MMSMMILLPGPIGNDKNDGKVTDAAMPRSNKEDTEQTWRTDKYIDGRFCERERWKLSLWQFVESKR